MNCALWLNKRKIRRASEIPENLDVASLRGYFLAGSLSEWLLENGGERYAKRLAGLSPDDPALNEKLARIFGGKGDFGKALNAAPPESVKIPMTSAMPSSFPSSFASSFTLRNSFRFSHFGSGGSFSYEWLTSFGGFWEFLSKIRFGSFRFLSGSFGSLGKFHEWEWEWLFELYKRWSGGSFTFSTLSFGSFHQWEWEWLLRLYGGGFGSFSLTSFSSFGAGFGSFDVFNFFGGKSLGSFELKRLLENLELDEYDRIMFETLMLCPLDRFGYGIHNI